MTSCFCPTLSVLLLLYTFFSSLSSPLSLYHTDKPVSPKSGTLKNPVKGFDTPAVSKTYYNLVRTYTTYCTEI